MSLPPFISGSGTDRRSTPAVQQMQEPMDLSSVDPMELSLENVEVSAPMHVPADVVMNATESIEGQSTSISPVRSHSIRPDQSTSGMISFARSSNVGNSGSQIPSRNIESGQIQQVFPFADSVSSALPYLPAWLMGPRQGGVHHVLSSNNPIRGVYSSYPGMNPESVELDLSLARNLEATGSVPVHVGNIRASGRSFPRHRPRYRAMDALDTEESIAHNDESDSQFGGSNISSEVAASLVAAAAAELPCTVKLRIWLHDIHNPSALLDSEKCRLTIPHAVLCRYVC